MFNRLEKIGYCVVIVKDTFDRLIHLYVTKMRIQGRSKGTYREEDTEACVYCLHKRKRLDNDGKGRWNSIDASGRTRPRS